MLLKCLPDGMFGSNCYIIGDSGEGALIDAGVQGSKVVEEAGRAGLKIKYIILTHGHIDHIAYVDEIREKLGAKVIIHENDGELLGDPVYNGSQLFGKPRKFKNADILVKDEDVFSLGEIKLEILHTPGHTQGCICIKAGNSIFTGDTLFKMSIGRTDLGKGNYNALIDSIVNKVMVLDDRTEIYPGHGPSTTIEFEKSNNPYIRI